MPFEFKLPDLGEGIQEAELLAWNVAAGDQVAAFQPVCQVESAKAAVELTAPVAGRIGPLLVQPGETVHLGQVLVTIDADDGWFGIVGRAPEATAPATAAPVRAAPFVRKLARDLNVPLETVRGSGPQGRIRAADVEAAVQQPQTPSEAHIPLRGLRREIAEHMVQAVTRAPQVTAMDLFDLTELVHAREALQATAESEGTKLSYLPFFVKASIAALRAVPEANAVVDDTTQAIVLKREYNIGIATAVPGGLIVPVVKAADRLTLLQLSQEIDRLVTAARERRTPPGDLKDGTFTITSFGGLPGSPMFATPILNYPEVAILGVGRIDLQPRVVDGLVVARHCAGMSFTFDHRVMDGESAGRFMAVLRRHLEQPLQFLLHAT
jgi:pyruvate dehydrogenase E2 component (dihydrolipoamide acetyltransferase)